MIIVATPSKPFTYTGKGTARRPAIIALYEDEINMLYSTFPASSSTVVDVPKLSSIEETTAFVRQVVVTVLDKEVTEDANIFQHGCDRYPTLQTSLPSLRGSLTCILVYRQHGSEAHFAAACVSNLKTMRPMSLRLSYLSIRRLPNSPPSYMPSFTTRFMTWTSPHRRSMQ
jgi:hypothetical protein